MTDTERMDWLATHPIATKWNHERGFIVLFHWGLEGVGGTFRDAVDDLIVKHRVRVDDYKREREQAGCYA